MNNNSIKKNKKQVNELEQKKIDLTKKKKGNEKYLKMADKYKTKSGLKRIEKCGNFFQMITDKDFNKSKVVKTNRCKDRFCPYCSYFEAKKDAVKILVLMSYIKKEYDKEFIFISLTAPNVPGEKLDDEIKDFNSAFKRLIERKNVDSINKGYIRKLEITYSKERDDYHPHFHIIMAVNKSYFTDKNYYISQNEWLELWKESKRDDSITQVDVRKVKPCNDKSHLELAKYTAKDADYLINQNVFDVFYKAMKGKRLIVFNQLFKDANNLYKEYMKLSDEDKKENILYHFFEKDDTEYLYLLLYKWGYGKYIEEEKRFLTLNEYKKYNIG